ncbi:hypothetical protein VN97_g9824, partial [Penicillium thymicola]
PLDLSLHLSFFSPSLLFSLNALFHSKTWLVTECAPTMGGDHNATDDEESTGLWRSNGAVHYFLTADRDCKSSIQRLRNVSPLYKENGLGALPGIVPRYSRKD